MKEQPFNLQPGLAALENYSAPDSDGGDGEVKKKVSRKFCFAELGWLKINLFHFIYSLTAGREEIRPEILGPGCP